MAIACYRALGGVLLHMAVEKYCITRSLCTNGNGGVRLNHLEKSSPCLQCTRRLNRLNPYPPHFGPQGKDGDSRKLVGTFKAVFCTGLCATAKSPLKSLS